MLRSRGVHRPDEVQVARNAELLLRIGERRYRRVLGARPFGRLDQGDELPKYLGDVAPVDLVDDENVSLVRMSAGARSDPFEDAVASLISEIVSPQNRPDALDEILVGVALVGM